MCQPCYVRTEYELKTPVPCERCGRVRRPFSKGLCKSCYQVVLRAPDASLRGSEVHRERATHPGLRREASGKWKGGRFIDAEGYVRVLRPADYDGPCIHGGRYVHEHRYVAEKKIGRRLRRGEVVHHLNHDRADNRPENIDVLPSVSAHRRLHAAEWREAHPENPSRRARTGRASKPAR